MEIDDRLGHIAIFKDIVNDRDKRGFKTVGRFQFMDKAWVLFCPTKPKGESKKSESRFVN